MMRKGINPHNLRLVKVAATKINTISKAVLISVSSMTKLMEANKGQACTPRYKYCT